MVGWIALLVAGRGLLAVETNCKATFFRNKDCLGDVNGYRWLIYGGYDTQNDYEATRGFIFTKERRGCSWITSITF